ncbi:uncharacterized protein [Rhodnius prolixus]|uniref:C2H2-type domain-containing protein n=1 Tax=Rhodnius prolixus TaxID=13249 RepID=T1IB18_RHOPR
MANSLVASEENYGFNLEWIAEGSGIGEEICGVDKDCIVVPSSPILTKIEPVEVPQQDVDDYVEIQVTEEEVITDQWDAQNNGSEEEPLHFRVDGNPEEDVVVPLPEEQDEYSRLHPYPCDFCSRRFSKKSGLTMHMLSHQIERPHECNLCGASYSRKAELVEHMKIHAYAPIKTEEEEEEEEDEEDIIDDYDQISAITPAKTKQKFRRRKNKESRTDGYSSSNYGEHSDDKLSKRLKRQNASWSYLDDDVKMMVEMARQAAAPKFPIIDPSRPYVCQHCGVGFAREKALTSHTMVHIGDSAFECDYCHDMFQTEKQLEEHISTKHEKHILNMNRRKNNNYSEIRMNFKQEDADLECHVCSLCNLVFSNFDELLSHKEDHDPEIGIHACYLCNEVYEHVEDLKIHMKATHRHSCSVCEKIFKDEKALNRHLALHPENRSFPCTVCHRRFNNRVKLKKHLATHDDQKQGILCIDCEQEFLDGQSLLNHRQVDHGVNLSRLFPCYECGKTFNSRSSQQIHIRIHTGEKPYGCRFCWKAFGDGGTLRKHERIHTGEKPYVCPVCSKAFNQRVVLREHIRAHHSGTEGRLSESCYECVVCGSIFVSSRDLYSHLVQHSDENTAKHRFPSSRKYSNKKRKTNTIVTTYHPNYSSNVAGSDESSHEGDLYGKKKISSQYSLQPQPEITTASHHHEPTAISTTIDEPSLGNGFDTLLSRAGPRRARIVRSGKKGVPKGQNKRFGKGKAKTSRLLNNASYASKYVVSQPDGDCINETSPMFESIIKTEISPPELQMNGNSILSLPKSRPRTKNVSYHNMREARFEIATFPTARESKGKKSKKGQKTKIKREEPSIDTQFVNGIDTSLFDGNHHDTGEQIETCIVDDIDVELKLEVKTTEDINMSRIGDILIKTEMVSCDMCSESFLSKSELLKHIQIHI